MVYFIIAIVLLIIAEVHLFNECKIDFFAWLSTIAICAATCLLLDGKKNKCPEAIDVYRGKTTLKITYEGNIPIDTVVVFKNSK